jgi:hypothetical protein
MGFFEAAGAFLDELFGSDELTVGDWVNRYPDLLINYGVIVWALNAQSADWLQAVYPNRPLGHAIKAAGACGRRTTSIHQKYGIAANAGVKLQP